MNLTLREKINDFDNLLFESLIEYFQSNICILFLSNQNITFMKIKQKIIKKTAHVQEIKPFSQKINILIISKIAQLTSPSQNQIYSKQVKVEFQTKHSIKTKQDSNKRQKKFTFSSESQNSQSQFIPERNQLKLSETKNISTSYGKMILRFILTQKTKIHQILEQHSMSIDGFDKIVSHFNRHMYSVSDLRKMWQDGDNEYSKVLRIISMNFLRKHSLQCIFNSRIKIFQRNLKYRHRIIEGVKNPSNFNMLKGS